MTTQTPEQTRSDAMEAVYDALGGRPAVMALFDVGTTSLSNWKTAGSFPSHLLWRVYVEMRSRGFDLDPTDPRTLRPSKAA